MIKKLIQKIFFANPEKQKILFGPSSGMYVKYDMNHRLQHLVGLYEREIYPYLFKGMKKADVLVDVGANDGYYVMAFLKTGKKVIACEAGDIHTEIIKNALLNNYDLGINFEMETRLIGSFENYPCVSPSVFVDENKKYFFLVDIDGGEFNLLQSCSNEFPYGNVTWLFETHSLELEVNCSNFLRDKGYHVQIIKNAWWRKFIPEQRPFEHNRWFYATFKEE